MKFDLRVINHNFKKKPLLVGGQAKEYYQIRENTHDVDFVVSEEDYKKLIKKYPHNLTDIWGDYGVKIKGFDLLKTLILFDYDYLSQNSIEKDNYKIISLEKLLFITALAMQKTKYAYDLKLIVKKVLELQYKKIDTSKYLKMKIKTK